MSGLVKKVDAVMAKYMDYPNPKYGSRLIIASAIIKAVAEWLMQTEDRECNPLQALANELKEGSE